jgi:penicillin-binding protein 1A
MAQRKHKMKPITIKKRRRKKAGFKYYVKCILLVGAFFLLGAVVGLAVTFYYFSLSLPAIGPLLEGYNPPQTTRIVARDGTVLGELFTERRTVTPLDKIPKVMVEAVIAAEDGDFRRHKGLDYTGMVRAALANLQSGRLAQGASTITQQVARTFFLTREKKFSRKIREILLTKRIEDRLTKDEILFLYLNQINFGHARYGIYEAARFYFDKSPQQITLEDAALLAGIPKGPAVYSPVTHPQAAKARRAYVLGEMVKLGKISQDEADQANRAPFEIEQKRGFDSSLAPEAVSLVMDEIGEIVTMESLRQGGYRIETTLDPALQRSARKAVLKGIGEIDRRHRRLAPFKATKSWPPGNRAVNGKLREGRTYVAEVVARDNANQLIEVRLGPKRGLIDLATAGRYNPKKLEAAKFAEKGAKLYVSLAAKPVEGEPLKLRLDAGPQAAVVLINPTEGSIAAMIGGDAVKPGGFNRAITAVRQPGSAFKPFVYLVAIRSGRYTPATILDDAPEVHGEWQPKNTAKDTYAGAVRLRQAIAQSMNLPAVKLITEVGPEQVVELAVQLGITSKLEPTPAMALGASAVSPLEIGSFYAALSNKGRWQRPWIVKRVVRPDGIEIPLMGRSPRQVVTEQEAYIMTSLLTSVVEEGTGARARQLGRPAAGKTGTSNDQRDAWFVGFTPDYTAVVWVGFDDFRPLGKKEYGGRAALPIWLEVMKNAHGDLPRRDFEMPEGIVTVRIDAESGLLAYDGMEGTIEEVFIEGTEPTETAVPPDLVSPDGFLFDQMQYDGGISP